MRGWRNSASSTDMVGNHAALSVCMVSYNTRAQLERCLAAVARQDAAEIIVVDNGSADGSADAAARCPNARLVQNAQNLDYTRAMNQALGAARGEFLLLLNPDTEPLPGALAALRAALDANAMWGAAGARLEFPGGALQRTGNRFPTRRWLLYDALGVNARLPGNPEQQRNIYADWDRRTTRTVDALSGAALLVRRAMCEQVGLLDEQFPMYFEEVDWCYRMAARGWQVGYIPNARIAHYAEQSARQLDDARRNALYETSFLHYARKYYGEGFGALLKGILRTRHALRGRRRA